MLGNCCFEKLLSQGCHTFTLSSLDGAFANLKEALELFFETETN
jgi:predicted RNase H-like HicB family nuclease